MRHQGARRRAESALLEAKNIRTVVRALFRRSNDYGLATLGELPAELARFGMLTVKDLRILMNKHRHAVLIDENFRMSRAENLWLSQELGSAALMFFAGKSWLALPGLVRQAMELEFGKEAAVYAATQRD